MPFVSEAQRRFMWAKHPDIARRWAHKYGSTPQAGGSKMFPPQAGGGGKMAALANMKAAHGKKMKRKGRKPPFGGHSAAHPGFSALVARGVPPGALANAARNASPAAKRKNPRLNRVKGPAPAY